MSQFGSGLCGADRWVWWGGQWCGRRIGWSWTVPVALVVALASAGWQAGREWSWLGPVTWAGLITLRMAVRWPLLRRLGTASDEGLVWFLGDDAFTRLPRRAWPRILAGSVGSLATGLVAVAAALAGTGALGGVITAFASHLPWAVIASTAILFTLIHLLVPLPGFDGAWLWRGLWLPLLGVRRAALAATGQGILIGAVYATISIVFGWLIGALFSILLTVLAILLWRQIRSGFDPVEDAPLPERARDPGLFARWRARRAETAAERAAAQSAQDDADVDRLLAKVSAHGLTALSDSERRHLQAISARRRA